MTGGPSTFYLFQDVGGFSGPNERLGVGVVLSDISLNGLDQLGDVSKATASNLFLRDVSKEALDHVEPGSTGRSEMNIEIESQISMPHLGAKISRLRNLRDRSKSAIGMYTA